MTIDGNDGNVLLLYPNAGPDSEASDGQRTSLRDWTAKQLVSIHGAVPEANTTLSVMFFPLLKTTGVGSAPGLEMPLQLTTRSDGTNSTTSSRTTTGQSPSKAAFADDVDATRAHPVGKWRLDPAVDPTLCITPIFKASDATSPERLLEEMSGVLREDAGVDTGEDAATLMDRDGLSCEFGEGSASAYRNLLEHPGSCVLRAKVHRK